MSQIYILCVDDEIDVLEQLNKDLSEFNDTFPIKLAHSAEEARELIPSLTKHGDQIGVVLCSHYLPGQNGIEFMISLRNELEMTETRTVLITRRAGLEETIKGLNEGRLNYYLAIPWSKEDIITVVRDQITDFFIRSRKNPMAYLEKLSTVRVFEAIHKGILPRDE